MDRDLARAIEVSLNVSQDDRENEPSVIVIGSSVDEETEGPDKTAEKPTKPVEKPQTKITSEKDQSIILIESSFEEDDDHKLAQKLQAQFNQERAVFERRKEDYKRFTESQSSTPSKGHKNRPIPKFNDYELARELQM